jgi:hypothetical protein
MNAVTSISAIVCNEDLFNARPGDEQFTVAFHEHLGLKGIETNDSEDFSRYPISKHLMAFANPRTVVRWELSTTERVFEAPRKGCNLYIKGGNRGAQINGYTFTGKSKADFIARHERYENSEIKWAQVNSVWQQKIFKIKGYDVYISHKSTGFDAQVTWRSPDLKEPDLKERTVIHPENLRIRELMYNTRNLTDYAELKAKLDPSLDVTIPARSLQEWLVSLLPSCDKMYEK